MNGSLLFQFPSNGKAYPKRAEEGVVVSHEVTSFNSLQTGKRIQSDKLTQFATVPDVSIPFKRESVSKVVSHEVSQDISGSSVSIPFKRESVSKAEMVKVLSHELLFQFPSNGKAYPKRPYFAPSRSVAPEPQNPTRTARCFFCLKIYP